MNLREPASKAGMLARLHYAPFLICFWRDLNPRQKAEDLPSLTDLEDRSIYFIIPPLGFEPKFAGRKPAMIGRTTLWRLFRARERTRTSIKQICSLSLNSIQPHVQFSVRRHWEDLNPRTATYKEAALTKLSYSAFIFMRDEGFEPS